ncbi:flavin-dependent oxidoreductase [Pseudonocardia sp. Ae168_Ps1]|uniref:LLM class flavin-dependent oxidoreductase n=1 Tax=unclassified Pseudonocardia TaxID=2619320 RepID=UPI00095C7BE5|nr:MULTISPECIES: LLM class flavin-dependent oxidoreductase [unclassified Pseudonocardia]OLL73277.1 flavin-dependent oxidoreductase [Pseudonocardia sp. Ae150A_Ps1]OLL79255.1 flavin-dependent oxidoreductase [Pseudonocardia sp. Ae168_Ps1]OLL86607.1 flavin-dependent oxidoreductase [Pseudonocardia sp. Ae263_Ps1]OLL93345.1 flavin-dependent oxidoreductase [Pseudonocardia sp. Ae356_Ps1]
MTARRIHLNAFDMTCAGHQSPGLWRHPDDESHRFHDLTYWTDLAQLLERGGFTSLFVADVLGLYDVYRGGPEPAIRDGIQVPVRDPTLAVSAMAAVTERLGFGITVSLTYEKPYAFARRLATLDHYTRGRVAWNVVTSYLDSAARNLGLEVQVPHDRRYDVADEFMDVVYQLWEASWDADAVRLDRENGIYTDPEKVHPIGHHGEFFDVPGIGLTEPSPQRTPTIFQAGASPRGSAFAARHAEGVFVTAATPETLAPRIVATRRTATELGRDPRSLKYFSLLTVVTGATDAEAQEKYEDLRRYVSLEGALTLYGGWSGLDLSTMDPDEPLRYAETEALRSAVEQFTTADPDREWTPRDIAEHIGIGGMGAVVVGGPETVADEMAHWVDVADVDGFNLAYATTPGTFTDVVEHVVPELRRRGMLAERPEGATLREHLYGEGHAHALADHPAAAHVRRTVPA